MNEEEKEEYRGILMALQDQVREEQLLEILRRYKAQIIEENNSLAGLSDEEKERILYCIITVANNTNSLELHILANNFSNLRDYRGIIRICPICKMGFRNKTDALKHAKKQNHWGDYNVEKKED